MLNSSIGNLEDTPLLNSSKSAAHKDIAAKDIAHKDIAPKDIFFGAPANNIAYVDKNGAATYGELYAYADAFAAAFPPRSLVLLLAANMAQTLIAYVGLMRRNVVVLLLAADTDQAVLDSLIASYQPDFLVDGNDASIRSYVYTNDCDGFDRCPDFTTDDKSTANDKSTTNDGVATKAVAVTKAVVATKAVSAEAIKNANAICAEKSKATKIHPNLALLLTTSGSTGSRKFVRLSMTNVQDNASSIVSYLNITSKDKAITTLPFSYSYGLSIINSHLLAGATILLTEATLFDRDFWSFFKENEATTFGGVPYTYAMLKQLRFARMQLPSLRYITQAGGRLSEELQLEYAQVCAEKGIDFIVMYGQTEATARMSYLPPQLAAKKIGSIGVAIPNGRFEILRDDAVSSPALEPTTVLAPTSASEPTSATEPTTATEPTFTSEPAFASAATEANLEAGELIYYGANVSMGYAQCRDDLCEGDTNNGRLATGDIAVVDADGFYRIVGRKKRFLKVFGNRVNLDELESLLSKNGFIAAATGVDDHVSIYLEIAQSEESLKASATSAPVASTADAVRQFLSNKTGLHKDAFNVITIAALPRNDAGKIQYAKLEDNSLNYTLGKTR
jgi:acyl-CoA synthetase (AMP-forming)/AMP-acid ligase II